MHQSVQLHATTHVQYIYLINSLHAQYNYNVHVNECKCVLSNICYRDETGWMHHFPSFVTIRLVAFDALRSTSHDILFTYNQSPIGVRRDTAWSHYGVKCPAAPLPMLHLSCHLSHNSTDTHTQRTGAVSILRGHWFFLFGRDVDSKYGLGRQEARRWGTRGNGPRDDEEFPAVAASPQQEGVRSAHKCMQASGHTPVFWSKWTLTLSHHASFNKFNKPHKWGFYFFYSFTYFHWEILIYSKRNVVIPDMRRRRSP